MPYRVRPINWDLLLQPTMAGISIKAQADRDLANTILSSTGQIAEGIDRTRALKESTRRFDVEQARLREAMQLREAEFLLEYDLKSRDRLDEQARGDTVLAALGLATENVVTETNERGRPSPAAANALIRLEEAAGGRRVARARLNVLAAQPPAPPAPRGRTCINGVCSSEGSTQPAAPVVAQGPPSAPPAQPTAPARRAVPTAPDLWNEDAKQAAVRAQSDLAGAQAAGYDYAGKVPEEPQLPPLQAMPVSARPPGPTSLQLYQEADEIKARDEDVMRRARIANDGLSDPRSLFTRQKREEVSLEYKRLLGEHSRLSADYARRLRMAQTQEKNEDRAYAAWIESERNAREAKEQEARTAEQRRYLEQKAAEEEAQDKQEKDAERERVRAAAKSELWEFSRNYIADLDPYTQRDAVKRIETIVQGVQAGVVSMDDAKREIAAMAPPPPPKPEKPPTEAELRQSRGEIRDLNSKARRLGEDALKYLKDELHNAKVRSDPNYDESQPRPEPTVDQLREYAKIAFRKWLADNLGTVKPEDRARAMEAIAIGIGLVGDREAE